MKQIQCAAAHLRFLIVFPYLLCKVSRHYGEIEHLFWFCHLCKLILGEREVHFKTRSEVRSVIIIAR